MSSSRIESPSAALAAVAAPLSAADVDVDAVRVAARQVRAHFQPIVDLAAGTILGYEVLSRAPRFPHIADAFTVARRHGLGWEFEAACRHAALERIFELNDQARGLRFFLNVGPEVLSDPRFISAFSGAVLRSAGVEPSQVVLELTEQQTVSDHARFTQLIQHYANQGFEIALDDFGVGNSSLVTLVSSTPHFLKLDRELVRGIHTDVYRQRLVRSLVGFGVNLEAKLVAEGVESWEELEVLVRLGVRYAQGYLFGGASERLQALGLEQQRSLRKLLRGEDACHDERGECMGQLVASAPSISARGVSCGDVARSYAQESTLDEIVVLDDCERPVGLLTRQHFFDNVRTAAGSQLDSLLVEEVAKSQFLVVKSATEVTCSSRLAMERARAELYDPVIVVGPDGRYVGTVSIRKLLVRSAELETRGASAITGLAGYGAAVCWITNVLLRPDFTIVYADLDQLGEYNAAYGFVAGDALIRLAARVLAAGVAELGDARLGHLGGDDFVIVCAGECNTGALHWICAEFDREKAALFRPAHAARGEFPSVDRKGRATWRPLTTLSLAAIDGSKLSGDVHPALLFQIAASLKKKAKQETSARRQSLVLFERRSYPAEKRASDRASEHALGSEE